MNAMTGKLALAAALTAGLGLAGCATGPFGNGGYNDGYNGGYQGQNNGYGNQGACQRCGVVKEVQQIYTDGTSGNGGTLGAVIGAIAGGVLGHQVGDGDGRTAATVAGAVVGGVVGHKVGESRGGGRHPAYRIVVRMDDGQYMTVTQRENPGVRSGDYVQVRNDHVYAR